MPFVVETSAGCDRTLLAILSDAYRIEFPGDKERERTVLRLNKKLAPLKVAVLPLMKKPQLEEIAAKIRKILDRKVREKLSQNAAQLAEKFTLEKNAEKTLRIYERIIKEKQLITLENSFSGGTN